MIPGIIAMEDMLLRSKRGSTRVCFMMDSI
jgi:hypothetical protein